MTRIIGWEHARTAKAILVDSEPVRHTGGKWFPLCAIKIISREHVKNPLFGSQPHIAEYLGWRIIMDVPEHLL